MKVIMLTNTRYLGDDLKKGDDVGVEDKVGQRWCSMGIAKPAPQKEDKGGGTDGSLPSVRNESPASGVPGDTGGEPSGEQRKAAEEGKRDSGSGSNGKHKPKQR